jgi:uncharacterized protein (TIGR03437 family)
MRLTKHSLKALLLLTLGCVLAFAQVAVPPINYAYSGPPQNINFTGGSVATFVPIQVPSPVTITKVTVTVDISYPLVSDLNLYLFSPDGTRTKLLERNCEGTPNATLLNMAFDDSASTLYNSFCPAEAGRGPFKGNEPLSNFNGKAAAGTWTLGIQNVGGENRTGVVNGVTLSIAGIIPSTPTISPNAIFNPLTLQTGPIAPGEILAVVGSNIGPAAAVSAPAGNLPTTLGGVQLMINDTLPAPIAFASVNLVVAVLPYTAGGSGAVIGGTVKLNIIYNGITSNSVTTGLALASPGLFSVSRTDSNKTQVKAVNPDGTSNAPDNPVAAGSVVTIYAAGLGPVTPTFTAGQMAPTNQQYTTTAPTFVSVASQTGDVSFSGLAPGMTGVYQVNARIPSTVPSGPQPVLLWNSAGTSQNGLQIYIK